MKPNPRRLAALVGALAVAGVTATGVIVGTASAAGTGTCTESVNVRSEPSATAPIVAVCERGETTALGTSRNGFVELPEYDGWASEEYVSTSSSSAPDTRDATDATDSDELGSESTAPSSSPRSAERSASPSATASPGADEDEDAPSESRESAAPDPAGGSPSFLGGGF